jgi:chromosome segregation ATPase
MSTTTVVPLMDVSSLTQPFVEATKLALEKIVAGTSASTIIEPQHQEILRVLISNLPCSPQVASAREGLERLLLISTEIQEAKGEIGSASSKQSEAMTRAESAVATLEDDLKGKSDVISSVTEQQLERHKLVEVLSVKLSNATRALRAGEEELAQLNLEYSEKQSEVKKLRDSLHDVNSQAAQELKALEEKTLALEADASSVFETLKDWGVTVGIRCIENKKISTARTQSKSRCNLEDGSYEGMIENHH